MTAAEKLERYQESGVLKDAWAVLAVLPEIIAVLKIAERTSNVRIGDDVVLETPGEWPQIPIDRNWIRQLRAVLSALDEKLGAVAYERLAALAEACRGHSHSQPCPVCAALAKLYELNNGAEVAAGTAAEKLEALDKTAVGAPWVAEDDGFTLIPTVAVLAGNPEDRAVIAALRNALPQIVAVVEAAERYPFDAFSLDRLSDALSALDEKLNGAEHPPGAERTQ